MKMKKRLLAALFCFSSCGVGADDGPNNLTITGWCVSDYVFRGVSQTSGDPALQAGADYTHDSGFYAGLWASPVDFGDESGADVEVDFYAGYGHDFGDDWNGDVQLIRYDYPGIRSGYSLAYDEWIARITWKGIVTGMVAYSSNVLGSGEAGTYYNVSANLPLGKDWTVNLGLGHSEFADVLFDGEDYLDATIGIERIVSEGLSVALSHTTTRRGELLFGDAAKPAWLLTVKYAFEAW
jgi:uncharacterized protein (TIGR02001 family)